MSKEQLPGLVVPNVVRSDAFLGSWQRGFTQYHEVLNKLSISEILIGVTAADKENFYPVEIDLRNPKGPKTLIIVGRAEKTLKTHMMTGIVRRASDTIAPGHLRLNLFTDDGDPDKLSKSFWFQKHGESTSVFTRSPSTAKLLANLADNLKTPGSKDPELTLIQNLGRFFAEPGNPNISNIYKLLTYKGPSTRLTIATVKHDDIEKLEQQNISRVNTPAVWLFEADYPGIFHLWNNKTGELSPILIAPFES